MKIPFFTTFLLFIVFTTFAIRRSSQKQESATLSLLERERLANSVRRKPLDDLPFVFIPLDSLPFGACPQDEVLSDFEDSIRSLAEQKVVNLTGISNTDLKLQYGAPNISLLTEFDQNFTLLARSLQGWGARLLALGFKDEARVVFEFAVECRSDVSATYSDLADLYLESDEVSKVQHLVDVASTLNSLSKNPILHKLEDKLSLAKSFS